MTRAKPQVLTRRTRTPEEQLRDVAEVAASSLNLEGFTTTPERLLQGRERLLERRGKPRD